MCSRCWFFGDRSGTVPKIPRTQGARRATGPAPLREGGGAAMNGRWMHGRRKAAGAATGGVLRSAVAARAFPPATNKSSLLRIDQVEAWIDGNPQYSPRRPFLPLRTRDPQAIFLRAAPPSRRGANACACSSRHGKASPPRPHCPGASPVFVFAPLSLASRFLLPTRPHGGASRPRRAGVEWGRRSGKPARTARRGRLAPPCASRGNMHDLMGPPLVQTGDTPALPAPNGGRAGAQPEKPVARRTGWRMHARRAAGELHRRTERRVRVTAV